MIEIFYISAISNLIIIISILIRRIFVLKKQHKIKLANFYRTLSQLTDKKENTLQKTRLDRNINEVISDAKTKLNEDIFELQMDVFRKIAEN